MTAIWRQQEDEWRPLLPSGFPSEEKLHDLVEGSPNLLPLSGDPSLTVLGREVAVGPGYADLLAIEADGRLAIVEIRKVPKVRYRQTPNSHQEPEILG